MMRAQAGGSAARCPPRAGLLLGHRRSRVRPEPLRHGRGPTARALRAMGAPLRRTDVPNPSRDDRPLVRPLHPLSQGREAQPLATAASESFNAAHTTGPARESPILSSAWSAPRRRGVDSERTIAASGSIRARIVKLPSHLDDREGGCGGEYLAEHGHRCRAGSLQAGAGRVGALGLGEPLEECAKSHGVSQHGQQPSEIGRGLGRRISKQSSPPSAPPRGHCARQASSPARE